MEEDVREREREVTNLCTSRVHEVALQPAGWEVLFDQHYVVVPKSVNDGAGVADWGWGPYVSMPLAHSNLVPHVQKVHQRRRERRQELSTRDGRQAGQRAGLKR
jgi:hypothetical protein